MKLQQPEPVFFFSPHLKGSASFTGMHFRELAGVVIFFFAAYFAGGTQFILNAMIFIMVVALGQFVFQAAGFFSSSRFDPSIFHQSFLLILFLPTNAPVGMVAVAAVALSSFYHFSGRRAGYALQPVCLTLGLLQCLAIKPQFALAHFSPVAGALVFILWFLVRFPKSQIEIQRMLLVAALVPLLFFLHEKTWIFALLWSAVAGELIFDRALAPLSVKGRLWHGIVVLTLFALLLAGTSLDEAMVLTGLSSGFFACWIEESFIMRKA